MTLLQHLPDKTYKAVPKVTLPLRLPHKKGYFMKSVTEIRQCAKKPIFRLIVESFLTALVMMMFNG